MDKLNNILSNNNLDKVVLLIDNILKINETKLQKYYKLLVYENKNFKIMMNKINKKFKSYLQSDKIDKSNLKKNYIQYINKFDKIYNNKKEILNRKINYYKIKNNYYIKILHLFQKKINKYDNLINKIDTETKHIINTLNKLDKFVNDKPKNNIKINLLTQLKQLYKNKYKIYNKSNPNLQTIHNNITYLANIIDKNQNLLNNLENEIKQNLDLLDTNKNNDKLKKNIDLLILFNKNSKQNLNLCLIQQTKNLHQLYDITNNNNSIEYNNLLKLQINNLDLLISKIKTLFKIESTLSADTLNKLSNNLLKLENINKNLLKKTIIPTTNYSSNKINLLIDKFTTT
jgi:hypothetical protein